MVWGYNVSLEIFVLCKKKLQFFVFFEIDPNIFENIAKSQKAIYIFVANLLSFQDNFKSKILQPC